MISNFRPLYIRNRPGLDTIFWPPALTWHSYFPTSSSAALPMTRLPFFVRTRALVLTICPFFSHWTSWINWFKCLALQWNWTSAPGIASASVGSSTKYKSRKKDMKMTLFRWLSRRKFDKKGVLTCFTFGSGNLCWNHIY